MVKRYLMLGIIVVLLFVGAYGAYYVTHKPAKPAGAVQANGGLQQPDDQGMSSPEMRGNPGQAQRGAPPSGQPGANAAPPSGGQPGANAAPPAGGQPGAGNNNRQGGMRNMDPQKMAEFRKKMEAFRETHKYTFQLMGLVGNIRRLDRDGKNPLTAAQAKQVLDILTPLRAQEHMTQDDAKGVIRDLQKVLTDDQRNEIAAMPERGGMRGGQGGQGGRGGQGGGPGGPGGGPGGPGGGPGGPPPAGGPGGGQGGPGGGQGGGMRGGPMMDPDTMQNFNPFSSASPMAERMNKFFDDLKQKAGQ